MNTNNKALSLSTVLRESRDFIWRERGHLQWPLTLFLGLVALQSLSIGLLAHWEKALLPGLAVVLMGGVMFLVDIAFSIGIVRAVVHGEYRPGWRFFRIDRQLWQCLWIQVLVVLLCIAFLFACFIPLGVIMMIFSMLKLGAMTIAVFLLFILACAWVRMRLTLAVPLRALGTGRPITEAWALARGHVWTLFWLMFLAWVPVVVLSVVVVALIWIAVGMHSFTVYSLWLLVAFSLCSGVCQFIGYVLQAHCCRTLRVVSVSMEG